MRACKLLLTPKYVEEQDNAAVSDDFEAEIEEFENADEGEALDMGQEESEDVGFSMGM